MKNKFLQVFTIKVGKFLQKSQKLPGFLLWDMLFAITCLISLISAFLLMYSHAVHYEKELLLKLEALQKAQTILNSFIERPRGFIVPPVENFSISLAHEKISPHFTLVTISVYRLKSRQKVLLLTTGYYE